MRPVRCRDRVNRACAAIVLLGAIGATFCTAFAEQPAAEQVVHADDVAARLALDHRRDELFQAGKYAEAIPVAEEVLRLTEQAFGPEHPDTANSLNNLAALYWSMGAYAEAEPLLKRVQSIYEKAFGPDHPTIATSLNNLAALYWSMGVYVQAEPLYRRALAIREKALGPDHPDTATTLDNLAVLYKSIGAFAEAEPLYRRALAIREKALGPDHPDTATSLNNLALLYSSMGAYAEAKPLHRRALAISEKALGPDHPDTAMSLNNLAGLYLSMGAYAEAEPLYRRALAIREKALGPDHPDTAMSLNNLAVLYKSIGAFAEAEPLYRRALAIWEKALGPNHPDTAKSLNNLAGLYKSIGAFAEAEPLYRRALAIWEKALGPNHPDTAKSLNNLAGLYLNMGAYAEAEPLIRRALAISEKALGPDHPDTAKSLNNLAGLYQDMGAYAETEPLYRRALAIREKALGPEHPDTANSLNNLALLYWSMGAYAEAEPLYQRALAISEKALGPDQPDTANSLDNLAGLYWSMGAYAEAEPLYRRALAIREKALGPDHPETATSLNNLAGLYWSMGAYAEAEPLYRRALAIYEKALGPEHPDTATNLHNLAVLYESMGIGARAEPLYRRALAISEKALGSEHPDTAKSLSNLAHLLHDRGHPGAAIFLGKRAVNALQASRAGMAAMEDKLQVSFVASKEHTYAALADWLIEAGRLAEAQRVLDMLKEQEAFEFVRRDRSDDPRRTRPTYIPAEAPWAARYDAISGRLAAIGAELEALERSLQHGWGSAADKDRYRALKADAKVANEAFLAFLDNLTKDLGAVRANIAENDIEDLGARQETLGQLGHGAVLVHYLVTDDELHAILTTPQIRLVRSTPVNPAALNELVFAFNRELRSPNGAPLKHAQALYDLLIRPLAAELRQAGARTLMLSLPGSLRYVAPAALHDGAHYLVEDYALALYSPSADDKLKETLDLATLKVAGMGVQRELEGFDPLPAVGAELERIVLHGSEDLDGVAPGLVHLDGDFTQASLEEALMERYPVLHLATHFHFEPGATEQESFLLLGDGAPLSLHDIRTGLEFRGVDLLTLSACETALGTQRADGREIDGLAWIAQERGARGVLATLWQVADSSTGELMETFYWHRFAGAGATKAEALRQAQLALLRGEPIPSTEETIRLAAAADASRGKMRDAEERAVLPHHALDYAHPYYWAPFILMGNWP